MGIEIKDCNGFFNKLKGLMFKKKITYGVKIRCNGIHTFFMFENINVILTNKDNKILFIYRNVKPWRIISPKKDVYYTYELPVNYKLEMKINDKMPF